ncbi:MAG: mechanosensitive ion channel family protein [Acidimicrobiia bacterium]|nr:mechanosensitive ion channel family protein [Acidimicrobiia bacterium]
MDTFAQTIDAATTCGADPGLLCSWVLDVTGDANAARLTEWLFTKPAKVLLIVLIAIITARIVRRAVAHGFKRLVDKQEVVEVEVDDASHLETLAEFALGRSEKSEIERLRSVQRLQTLESVLTSLASVVIYLVAILIILGEFNINLGPLIAGAGIAGIAIGFGAQAVVKDFLAGIFMLIEDQFGVGDVIDVGEATGVVEAVSLRTTKIRDVDGTVWFVPNGEIQRVGNKSQEWARAVVDVQVAYDTDLPKAKEVIKAVADEVWGDQLEGATIMQAPEIWGVQSFGDNSIAIRLALVTEPGEQFAVARVVRERLKYAFDEHGIEIPFPQRTVWMHQVGGGEAPTPAT